MKVKLESEHFNYMVISTFRFLFENDHFTDVSLVCEDNQQIWVHKVILSSVGEFSNSIFLRNSHQQPLIYLRVKHTELLSLVKFINMGQCTMYQLRKSKKKYYNWKKLFLAQFSTKLSETFIK